MEGGDLMSETLKTLNEVPEWVRPKSKTSESKEYAKRIIKDLKALPEGVNAVEIVVPKKYKLVGVHAVLSRITKKSDVGFTFHRDSKTDPTQLVAVRKGKA